MARDLPEQDRQHEEFDFCYRESQEQAKAQRKSVRERKAQAQEKRCSLQRDAKKVCDIVIMPMNILTNTKPSLIVCRTQG